MTKDSTREWRPVVGFEGRYEVSNYGEVWSAHSSRTMKFSVDKDGYDKVGLTSDHGKQYQRFVHRLVAEAFHGPSNGLIVRHLDGNCQNNFEGNLKWGTVAENNWDTIRHGRHVPGRPAESTPPRTHCKLRGHEMTKYNTYTRKDTGNRMCRACREMRPQWRPAVFKSRAKAKEVG